MFVACSTLCFSKEPLDNAFRRIADLEFNKIDLAITERGAHLRPSEVAENLEASLHKIRHAPSLTPAAIEIDFGEIPAAVLKRRFEAICRLAKPLTVAVLTFPAAPLGTSIESEIERLSGLAEIAVCEGLVPTLLTHSKTLTADPAVAAALCKAVPGLGLTLDPSHYLQGPNRGGSFDELYPYVRHVHFRDTGREPGAFQVRVGQGEIEYGKIVGQLERFGYDRGLTVAIHDNLDSPFEIEVEVRKMRLLLESLL